MIVSGSAIVELCQNTNYPFLVERPTSAGALCHDGNLDGGATRVLPTNAPVILTTNPSIFTSFYPIILL